MNFELQNSDLIQQDKINAVFEFPKGNLRAYGGCLG
jgi:hypothetical protein